MPDAPNRSRDGFTLIELLVVMAIIGILISLILVAAADGVRRAEERQTQTLITKLETALTDRVDALLATPAPINQTHRYLAAVTYLDKGNPAATPPLAPSGLFNPIDGSVERRAQVIAQFDFMKAELPDVFYPSTSANYPVNFGMAPYPLTATGDDAFALPLGNRQPGLPYTQGPPNPNSPSPSYIPTPGFDTVTGVNDLGVATGNVPLGLVVTPDTGIYGASFSAAAGLYKNLYEAATLDLHAKEGSGFVVNAKAGYDGSDNGGVPGLIDDIGEVTVAPAPANTFASYVTARLAKHDHKTARSEMLYALLVEGQGPLGSVYNREDFTNRDVADTDGDGLPEFIDAWGQPLQFYRWPIFYGSTVGSTDSQLNFQSYGSTSANTPRQLDPLDPNQLLTAFSWWVPATNTNPGNFGFPGMVAPAIVPDFATPYPTSPASQQANAFMTYFHILIDPQVATPPSNTNLSPNWDRTGTSRRRAYYSKFLVLSGGPDKEIGVFRLNKDYKGDIDITLSSPVAFPTGNPIKDSQLVNWCESQAAQIEYTGRLGPFLEVVSGALATPTSLYLQNNAGLDDISNHALTAPGSGAK